jgi:phenylalanyl-tRNA synthetase beta chain
LPEERETLCALLCGMAEPVSWHHGERKLDFYDAKSLVEFICDKCGVVPRFAPGTDAGLLPGRQADVLVDDEKLGVVGQLHPAVARACEVDPDIFVVELDVARLMSRARKVAEYEPLSRFPFSERDLAIVVDRSVTYENVRDIASGFALVSDVSLFDLYVGEQIPEGKKSFAIHLVFQAPDRTLTDAEVNQVQEKLVARLASGLGATLRS